MEPELVRKHLILAEQHVSRGEELLERQRALIRELERDGHDVRNAYKLLVQLERTQTLHIEDRDRLRDEIASLAPSGEDQR
jgi:hypothetical protein